MRKWSRREMFRGVAASLFAASVPHRLVVAADSLKLNANPFVLGVASGYPTPNSVVLWTRLLHDALGQSAVPVRWEVALDEGMRKIVRRGQEYATAEWAHSVHAEVTGLDAGREYWYRFSAAGQQSPIGRTRLTPAVGARMNRLRFAVASCQKYENGFYTAYRHMLDDNLDLIVHVGDYIYEYESGGVNALRGDGSGVTFTLDEYRARYALYKSDPNLQAAHAAYPWLVTWDDHEVVNDYFGDASYDQGGDVFLARRAAAYRAYYEHMPLPRSAIPAGPIMQLYTRRRYGNLLTLHMLDSRQYRSRLACLGDEDDGGMGARCARLFDAERTKLGMQQEHWLEQGLTQGSTWNVMAQGTPMAHVDFDAGPGVAYRRDVWDGYPAARQRLMDALVKTKAGNPIVLDGDIHAFQIANLHRQANDIASPVIASEFTATSISSGGISQRALDERRKSNPNVLLSDASRRGYLVMEFTPERVQADLVTVDNVRERESPRGLMARYVVENGKPGPIGENS